MKILINIVAIFLFAIVLSSNVFAETLNNITITTDKTTVNPGQNIIVNVNFGENLGSYTVDVAYDNNLFEYVSAEGGTADNNGTRVRVYFYDQTGGSSPRNNMSVIFKAKDVTTSNPTNFSITAEGLANSDASQTYDDITVPIIKDIIVEPVYVDYDIKLNYTGDVTENVEKDMKIVISSTMGKNYEHTRLLATATTPEGGTVKLKATDNASLEHDIIESGWGPAEGEAIGGKNAKKELNVRGLFTKSGQYRITFNLVDRDDSDSVIATKSVNITVKEASNNGAGGGNQDTGNNGSNNNQGGTNNNQGTTGGTNNQGNTNQKPSGTVNNNTSAEADKEQMPSTLPQTGGTIYAYILVIIAVVSGSYVFIKRKK